MTLSFPAARSVAADVGWPVARLIAGLTLLLMLLMLLMGSWLVTHSETEGSVTVHIAKVVVASDTGAAATPDGRSGEAGDLGAALCLLGIACVLALVVLACRVPSRSCTLDRAAGMVRHLVAITRSRMPVLTLMQLRVSRS